MEWLDSFGWLPIHYACASGSDSAVIHALAEHYPESKTTTDKRGRTPLHFAFCDKPASADVIVLLSSNGAASYPDEIGMLVSLRQRHVGGVRDYSIRGLNVGSFPYCFFCAIHESLFIMPVHLEHLKRYSLH